MEKHKCKLCFRSFNNGRALGGHMRSHVMNLAKQEEESSRTIQLSFEAESSPSSSSFSPSSPSSSSSEDENDDHDDVRGVCSVFKDNPKRSVTEFSGSMILQDRESETESSKNNPTRKRSKRVWEIRRCDHTNNNTKIESWVDHEPVSSVSDTTSEEDVAFCLMMLSRDKWKPQKDQHQQQQEEEDQAERSLENCYESHDMMKESNNNRLRKGRYKCETCDKVFRSYQALGGHRASHKKIKMNIKVDHEAEFEGEKMVEKKIHECPICLRVFASGQALGGHKRTHVNGSSATTTSTTTVPVFSSSKRFIDLNLPAPIDYDDDDYEISQIENSAVSDAEFVKTR